MEDNLYKAATENFNLPHDVVPLPSGGIFYKSKKKSIKVGYLTANDENILLGSLQNNKDFVVLSLLRNKIYEHDLRPEDLVDSDVEAILLFLRNSSFGPEYTVQVTDPKTDKKFTTTISLDELNIKKGNVLPDENGYYQITLPKSQVSIKAKPLTMGETLEIDRMVEQYPTGRIAPKITWRLSKMIKEVNGETEIGYISQFIDTLPIMDSKYIRNYINENQPSLDLTKKVMAPSGEMVDVSITFGVEFFRPFF